MSKTHGKKRYIKLILLFFLCAYAIYSASDMLIYVKRKPALEDFAKDYVSWIGKINTCENRFEGDNISSLAAGKEKQLDEFYKDCFIENNNNKSEYDLIKETQKTLIDNKAKIESFSSEFLYVGSVQKLPLTLHYNITVNYRLSWKYAGKAECFDGNSAACFFDKEKDGYRQGSETCSLSMEVKKSDGRFKILKITGLSCNS